MPPQQPSFISLLFLFIKKIKMTKKKWTPTPESELTEEEVRRWFNRLRELYREATSRIHDMKVERWQKNKKIFLLESENARLRKRNKYLEENIGQEPKKETVNKDKIDFKKKFFDSL